MSNLSDNHGLSALVITHRGTVYPWQCDHMGHMNVMWYVGKFDESSWQILSTLGLTPPRFKNEGVGMAAVEQRIQYRRELHAGDLITIHSEIREVGNKSIRFFHEMRNDATGDVSATMDVVGVCLDATTRKTRSLPEDVRERAMLHMRSHRPGWNESLPTVKLSVAAFCSSISGQ